MQKPASSVWETRAAQQFSTVATSINDISTMQNFLRDVMTEKEIIKISSRFEAAEMLQQGKKYTEIIDRTRLSSRTVARISDWMQNGCGGYGAALELVPVHHAHMSPARVE